jgi:hypothetical protein
MPFRATKLGNSVRSYLHMFQPTLKLFSVHNHGPGSWGQQTQPVDIFKSVPAYIQSQKRLR